VRPAALALVLALALAGCAAPTAVKRVTSAPAATATPTRVGHVFLIVLENKDYATTFGASAGSAYLGKELPAQGRVLSDYYGIGHASLDNYVAMISGQAPNPLTQDDCLAYADFRGAPTLGPDGQALGQGCVYPAFVKTLGDQLTGAGRSWRMYAEDMAASPDSAPTACRHPPLDARDPWEGARPTDQYATKHVPFVYFHSVIDDAASCKRHVVDLKLLWDDLNDSAATPAFSFVSPDLCSDGHDAQCVDGGPGGYQGIDAWLRAWVPRILSSPAYKQDGLVVITFDESDDDGSACCGEQPGYDTASPGLPGDGGGKIGALLLSPCFTDKGGVVSTPANHYSLLRTIEDVYHVPHLGYAGASGLADLDLGACSAT